MMNRVGNTFHFDRSFDSLMDRKKALSGMHPESLYSMALYDVDAIVNQEMNSVMPQQPRQEQAVAVPQQQAQQHTPAFYPVDEYKDMSLKEILDISDDFLFGAEDPLMDDFPLSPTATPRVMEPQAVLSCTGSPPPMPVLSPPVSPLRSTFVSVSPSASTDLSLDTSTSCNNKKRRRDEDDEFDEDDEDRRFRPYQAGQWSDKFVELCEYRERMGHCLVPHTYNENLPLARWVKRQRYQYKLMQEGKPSTMTEERVKALEEVGFVWDSQRAAWEERLGELKQFRDVFMHCNVPSNYNENPQLATWVKCQRRQYKLHCQGKPSNMTPLRIDQLETLGFEWELRSYKKA